eukprot:4774543-Amphidinium_carterae.2
MQLISLLALVRRAWEGDSRPSPKGSNVSTANSVHPTTCWGLLSIAHPVLLLTVTVVVVIKLSRCIRQYWRAECGNGCPTFSTVVECDQQSRNWFKSWWKCFLRDL